MMKQAATEKLFVLGIDGMDPRLTKKYLAEGRMPNTAKLIARGSAREDLAMIGGQPTVTPPMWTTLATGTWPVVHGITGFSRRAPGGELGRNEYGLDSRLCKAEPMWNVFAEAGKKTLVIHWPGSSWPPTSDSPNLHVIDGTQPGAVNMGVAQIESEFVLVASEQTEEVTFKAKAAADSNVPCVITDLEIRDDSSPDFLSMSAEKGSASTIILKESDGQGSLGESPFDLVFSQVKPATGWTNAPEGAKEFTMLFSQGLIRRLALILPDEQGIYNRVALYNTKHDEKPVAILEKDVFVDNILGQSYKNDAYHDVVRNMRILELAEDGSHIKMWISAAMDIHNDSVWHPKRLYQDVVEHVGYPCSEAMLGAFDKRLVKDCMLGNWEVASHWQSRTINYLLKKEGYDVIFSHFHNIDAQAHMLAKFMKFRGRKNELPEEQYVEFMAQVYEQTDRYIGEFLYLLDEGWTIFLVSDHAIVCPEHGNRLLCDAAGICVPIMQELGFTETIKDADGNDTYEIDWDKTIAINKDIYIDLNIKGRNPHGIVEPEDQYEVEEQIITALYGYKDKVTGKRIVSLALRNREAILLGLGGSECGDIVLFMAEGYNIDHADCLTTTYGYAQTSMLPIFVAAGKGIKEGYTTQRYIRQIDLVPTMAALGGVRMPKDCEGAPIYQIMTEVY